MPKLAMSAKVLLPTPPLELAKTTERGFASVGWSANCGLSEFKIGAQALQ
jgi:hypothetical protein